jgi:hypothetical protein
MLRVQAYLPRSDLQELAERSRKNRPGKVMTASEPWIEMNGEISLEPH